jgi:transcriptional regulator NrdR family protein
MNTIIKRHGHKEPFDERKTYASCYAACINAHRKKEEAEEICMQVTDSIKEFIKTSNEISSDEIFSEVVRHMKRIDKEAGFMYETHRDIS